MTLNPSLSQILIDAVLFSNTKLNTEYLYPYVTSKPRPRDIVSEWID